MEIERHTYKVPPAWWRYGQEPMFKEEDMEEVEVEEPIHDGG